tara:strand:+ start:24069 stop:25064 length:996 start_codon:yes stop_codon:yes gene_type:complete
MGIIINASHSKYQELKQKLDNNINNHSPLHTESALDWYRQRPMDEGKSTNDCSFILVLGVEPVLGFQGVKIIDNKTSMLCYEIPCITIENKNLLTSKACKTFIKEFEKIITDVNGFISYRDFLIDGDLSTLSKHLLKKGANTTPFFTRAIDLSNDESLLKSSIRKSYKSLVNWGTRELDISVCDYSNINWNHINAFSQLHTRVSGHKSRSEDSWRRQFDMVQAGDAFIVLGLLKDELVSAGFFMVSKTNCYYGSSASRRDLFEKPLFHGLIWTAVLHAKKLGCHWFDMGEQLFPNHPISKLPTKKELDISGFKAGFGGETRVFLDFNLDCY